MPALTNNVVVAVVSAVVIWAGATVRFDPPRALAEAEPLVVVVAVAFADKDISLAKLKTAFRGQIAHVAGKPLVPINHSTGSPLRVEFDQLVLGLDPAAVGRFWVDQRIRDEAKPPKTVPTPEVAVRVVAAIPTAVTYARQSLLNPKVKTLTIDGKAAGESGYALARAR